MTDIQLHDVQNLRRQLRQDMAAVATFEGITDFKWYASQETITGYLAGWDDVIVDEGLGLGILELRAGDGSFQFTCDVTINVPAKEAVESLVELEYALLIAVRDAEADFQARQREVQIDYQEQSAQLAARLNRKLRDIEEDHDYKIWRTIAKWPHVKL